MRLLIMLLMLTGAWVGDASAQARHGHQWSGNHYGGHGNWHGGYWGPPYNGGGFIGGVVGGVIGEIIAPPVIIVQPPEVVVQEAPALTPWSPEWYEDCGTRYKSFDAHTGYFMGLDGQRHFCQ